MGDVRERASGSAAASGSGAARAALKRGEGMKPQLAVPSRYSGAAPAGNMIGDVFDGIDFLEEEDEEEEEEGEPEVIAWETVGPGDRRIGDGLLELEQLWEKYMSSDDEECPETEERDLAELQAAVLRDVKLAPSISTVSWTLKVMEEMDINDDNLFTELNKILVDREDELEPQDLLDATVALGNVYFTGENISRALCRGIRRQLADFTQVEVVKLANALIRMGCTDDTREAGLFFEMRQRVNLPKIDAFLKLAVGRGMSWYKRQAQMSKYVLDFCKDTLKDGEFKHKLQNLYKFEIEQGKQRLLAKVEDEQAYRLELEEHLAISDNAEMMGLLADGGGGSGGRDGKGKAAQKKLGLSGLPPELLPPPRGRR